MLICTLQTTNFVSLMRMSPLFHPTAGKKDLTLIRISRIFFDNLSPPISFVFLWATLMFAQRNMILLFPQDSLLLSSNLTYMIFSFIIIILTIVFFMIIPLYLLIHIRIRVI